jgi:hypothetical protein
MRKKTKINFMQTKQAKKVTAILSCDEFAKLQGNKDFLLNSQISGIQTEFALELKKGIEAINYAKKIGRYMLKGAEYFKSKEGKAELFKVGYDFTYVDFYMKELGRGKSAIYEYMDLGKLTDEQISEQTDKGISDKRKIVNACKGKNEGNEGEGEGEGEGEVKVKAEKFSVTMDKENKIVIKGENALTLSQITLLKKEIARIEKNIKDAKKTA